MLVNPDNCAVNNCVFKIWIAGQGIENFLENSLPGPAPETAERAVPGSEAPGQVTPRRPRPHDPQNRFDEETVIDGRPPRVAALARQKRRNLLVLGIA
jgi:hypothetical protein